VIGVIDQALANDRILAVGRREHKP
jgi:hypothetical protein